jgi:hypothetical protein
MDEEVSGGSSGEKERNTLTKAGLSQLVRAAVLFFAGCATRGDIEVYVREQIYLDRS